MNLFSFLYHQKNDISQQVSVSGNETPPDEQDDQPAAPQETENEVESVREEAQKTEKQELRLYPQMTDQSLAAYVLDQHRVRQRKEIEEMEEKRRQLAAMSKVAREEELKTDPLYVYDEKNHPMRRRSSTGSSHRRHHKRHHHHRHHHSRRHSATRRHSKDKSAPITISLDEIDDYEAEDDRLSKLIAEKRRQLRESLSAPKEAFLVEEVQMNMGEDYREDDDPVDAHFPRLNDRSGSTSSRRKLRNCGVELTFSEDRATTNEFFGVSIKVDPPKDVRDPDEEDYGRRGRKSESRERRPSTSMADHLERHNYSIYRRKQAGYSSPTSPASTSIQRASKKRALESEELQFGVKRRRFEETSTTSKRKVLDDYKQKYPGIRSTLDALQKFADDFPKNGLQMRLQELEDAELCVLELDADGNPAYIERKLHDVATLTKDLRMKPMPPGHFIPKTWPSNVVHYTLDNSFNDVQKYLIRRAINEFHEKTTIRLVPRTFQKDYIHIKHVVGACYSKLGFIGGRQDVCLSDKGVNRKGTIMHEIMHALGFDHEHSRPDRDKYVFINWCNISDGFEPQFKTRWGFLSENGRYDYGSVMHYPAHAFADLKILPTIIPSDKKIGQKGIGQRLWLSPDDVYKINTAYKGTTETCEARPEYDNWASCWDHQPSSQAESCPTAQDATPVADEDLQVHPRIKKEDYRLMYRPLVEEVCDPRDNIRNKVLGGVWDKPRKTPLKLQKIRKRVQEMMARKQPFGPGSKLGSKTTTTIQDKRRRSRTFTQSIGVSRPESAPTLIDE